MTEKIADSNSGLTLAIVLLILSMFLFGLMPALPYLLSSELKFTMEKAKTNKE